jgi:hypothetical protein
VTQVKTAIESFEPHQEVPADLVSQNDLKHLREFIHPSVEVILKAGNTSVLAANQKEGKEYEELVQNECEGKMVAANDMATRDLAVRLAEADAAPHQRILAVGRDISRSDTHTRTETETKRRLFSKRTRTHTTSSTEVKEGAFGLACAVDDSTPESLYRAALAANEYAVQQIERTTGTRSLGIPPSAAANANQVSLAPSGALSESQWSCPECTFHNHHLLLFCEMCNFPKLEHGVRRVVEQDHKVERLNLRGGAADHLSVRQSQRAHSDRRTLFGAFRTSRTVQETRTVDIQRGEGFVIKAPDGLPPSARDAAFLTRARAYQTSEL